MKKTIPLLTLSLGLLLFGQAMAQSAATPLPEWDKLTPQQREILIAPMRDRWNSDADSRAHMYEHAQRWKSMTPEQRQQARRGMRRFEGMDPHQRQEARAIFLQMEKMTPEQRKQLQEKLKAMTTEQRRAWMEQNRPKDLPPPR
jgi:hypothetical protein